MHMSPSILPPRSARVRPASLGALLLLLVTLPTGAFAASEISGRIAGYVFDPTGSGLSQVPITLRGPTVQPIERVTDDTGRYEFDDVPVGSDYVLEVNIPGFAAVRQPAIRVLAGQTTALDVRLQQLTESAPGATYELKAKVNPTLNPDSAQAGLALEAERVERLPVPHNAANLPQLLPGVGPGTRPATRGGLARYSKFFVDGLEVTDIVDGGLFVPLNFDAIENFEVLIGAMDAQYNGLGAVVNAVTKDGSNTFRYDLSLTASPEFFSAVPRYAASNLDFVGDYLLSDRPVAKAFSYVPVVSLSGPIIKDRLWFFTTLQVTWSNRDVPVQVPGQPASNRPNTTLTALGHAKFTWQPTDADRLTVALNPERNQVKNQIGTSQVSDAAETQIVRTEGWLLANYDHRFSDDVLFQLQGGVTSKRGDTDPVTPDPSLPSHTDAANNLTQFNAGRLSATTPGNYLHEAKWKFQLDPTLSWRVHGLGSHQLKAGLQLSYAFDDQTTGVLGGVRYLDRGGVCNPDDPSTFAFCNQRVSFYNTANDQAALHTLASATTASAFAQDRWTVNRQLTLIYGLRFDYGRLAGEGGTGVDLFGVGPRVSATYDVFADRKTLLVAHYGRANDVSSVFIAQRATPTLLQVTSTFDKAAGRFPDCTPTGGTGCTLAGGVSGNSVLSGQTPPHVDEISAGVHHELYPLTVGGLDFTWRRYANLWADQEINRIWDESGSTVTGYRDGVAHTLVQTVAPSSALRRYTGVDLWVEGTPGNWDLFASYTLAFNGGTVTDYSDGYLLNPSLAGYYNGPLPDDYRHTVKGWASYRFPFGLELGAKLQYRTGRPLWESFPNPGDPSQRLYRSPRGTGFAVNTATGQPDFNDPSTLVELRAPSQFLVDVQARYDLAPVLHLKDQRLELIGLVQNVFNDTSTVTLNDFYGANGRGYGAALTHNTPLQAQVQLRWRN